MDTIKKEIDLASKDEPRLKPIDNPKSIKLKLAYWLTQKKLGKVYNTDKNRSSSYARNAFPLTKTDEH